MDDVSPDVVSAIQESWKQIKQQSPTTWEDEFGQRFLKK